MQKRLLVAAVSLGAVALPAGCGGEEDDYRNENRPPAPILVAASISEDRVSVSPRRFGAGPITLIVTHQTQSAQEVTLETDEIGGSGPGIEQETGPISPGETASLKADLRQGTYRVGVNGRGIDEAALDVGEPRETAQDQLLQP
jgi:hypothetical protein